MEEEFEKVGEKATKLGIANIVMTTANQQYLYQFPRDVHGFRIQCRDGTTFRFAFEKDKVATATPSNPYFTVPTNGHVLIKNINVEELRIYMAEGTGGKVAEIISWS